ncbi:MAG: CHASE2 domain-containing protein, partial [Ramlibacter sp.]|nr:CHASE2 domain-containing protein [Ramlibacter sp.]
MGVLAKHWSRIAVTLIPLVFALLHAVGVLPIGVLQKLDDVIYDARLRATMPRTLDDRIVIIDIDEKSLAEVGRWPWSRNRLAELADELFDRQKVAMAGFDIVFAEADDSSGLKRLRQLAQGEFKDQPGFNEKLTQLQAGLDYDAMFARSLEKRPAVLGYYLTSDRDGRKSGVLPAPVMEKSALSGRPIKFTSWDGFGSNIDQFAKAAPVAGFFNPMLDNDGVVRSVPLLAEHEDKYYETLSLAMFRMLSGMPAVEPVFPPERYVA